MCTRYKPVYIFSTFHDKLFQLVYIGTRVTRTPLQPAYEKTTERLHAKKSCYIDIKNFFHAFFPVFD